MGWVPPTDEELDEASAMYAARFDDKSSRGHAQDRRQDGWTSTAEEEFESFWLKETTTFGTTQEGKK